jgi:hypothetical protein
VQRPTKDDGIRKNDQRSRGKRAISVSEKAAARRVPAIRMSPLFRD